MEKMRVQFARNLENGEIDPLVKENIRLEKERRKAKKTAAAKAKKNKKKKRIVPAAKMAKNAVSDKRLKKR